MYTTVQERVAALEKSRLDKIRVMLDMMQRGLAAARGLCPVLAFSFHTTRLIAASDATESRADAMDEQIRSVLSAYFEGEQDSMVPQASLGDDTIEQSAALTAAIRRFVEQHDPSASRVWQLLTAFEMISL